MMTENRLLHPLPRRSVIGIVGGGQLGRMLAMAAARLDYRVVVLDPAPDCPAGEVASRQIEAAYDDPEALDALGAAADVVTYEFENVPVAAARRLDGAVPVFPPPQALDVAQDRLVEKRFLNAHGIPTAEFHAVDTIGDLEAGLRAFGGRGVLKTRRMGYDGKGQHVFSGHGNDASSECGNKAGAIFDAMGGKPLILERLIAFEREISMIAARGRDGTTAFYDAAENTHRNGILVRSVVPSEAARPTLDAARSAARPLLEALDYVGVLGVEFFVTRDGGLLANEIAPRVHNSGHWTEAACIVSQFEQHIRAVAGLPLGPATRHSDCTMENLIGDAVSRRNALCERDDASVHLYGKAEARAGRKMGHFTCLGPLTKR